MNGNVLLVLIATAALIVLGTIGLAIWGCAT